MLATPEAVLSSDEKEEGVAVVDIGGGVTDVAVYYRGVPRYVATIPMGAPSTGTSVRRAFPRNMSRASSANTVRLLPSSLPKTS